MIDIINLISPFFDSTFFNSLITILVGLFAFFIYKNQKDDSKKDAANIILLEIKNAERCLKPIKESLKKDNLPEDKFLMPTESWNKYKYLFVRDFDRDEWDVINDFYCKCQLYDQAVSYNNSFFQKNEEQLRINMHKIIADITITHTKKVSSITPELAIIENEKYNKLCNEFKNNYMQKDGIAFYNPQKPILDAQSAVDNLNINISQTTIGAKLKKLANLKE